MESRRASRVTILLIAAVAAICLHAGHLAAQQGPFCIDDAYISFRYAENLAGSQGLVFNPGERVEGYTNFGWVVLMAGLHGLGAKLDVAARLLNVLLASLLIVICGRFAWRHAAHPLLAGGLVVGLLATDGSLARWSQDGLETVLFALLVTGGLLRAVDEARTSGMRPIAGLVLGAACLVRPEGLMFAGLGCAARWILDSDRRVAWRAAFLNAGWVAALVVPWFVWRVSYYGFLLPNTFYAKVGRSSAQVMRGVDYTSNFWLFDRPGLAFLIVVAICFGVLSKTIRPWHLVLLLAGALHVTYVTVVGGDWMGPGRFFVPVVPLVVIPVADLAARFAVSRTWRPAAVTACILLVGSVWWTSSALSEARDVARERAFLESRAVVGEFVAAHALPEDRLLTNEIGQLAWDTELYTADLHGLIDPQIAHMTVEGLGKGKAGHEKVDFAYSLSQDPTWIVIPGLAQQWRAEGHPLLARFEIVEIDEPILPPYRMVLRKRDETRRRAAQTSASILEPSQ